MAFQKMFNSFINMGGRTIVLVRNNGLSSKISLDNNQSVKNALNTLGNHPVKDVSLDSNILKIYLGKPKVEKHNWYHYAHSQNGFTFVDMGN